MLGSAASHVVGDGVRVLGKVRNYPVRKGSHDAGGTGRVAEEPNRSVRTPERFSVTGPVVVRR